MDRATRATLEGWRNEIVAEIQIAAAELAASRAALEAAQEAEAAEKSRVGALIDAWQRFAAEVQVANALRDRFIAAAKYSRMSCTRGHTEAIAAAEFKLADLQTALDQVDILLRPAAPPVLALVDARTIAPAPVEAFDPIVKPWRGVA